jgi:hypothetical protein
MKRLAALKTFCASSLLFVSLNGTAQTKKSIDYTPQEIEWNTISHLGDPQINAEAFKTYQIDVESLRLQLLGIAQREDDSQGFTAMISFPHPDGTMHEYQALANRTLSKGLGDKFPEIKTYDGADLNGRRVKWDITPKGLHVMILQPNESTIFIDPVFSDNDEYYMVYYKKDFYTDKLTDCSFTSDNSSLRTDIEPVSGNNRTFGTCELRTYRLALAATGEYTVYHGGSVGDAQSAQATTMNRVNGVFERDIAITMEIVPNNNLIIYTNAGSDPYSNGNPGSMINQNQSNCDGTLGNGAYDIGHVFGTNSGGLAGLGVVCNNSNKARGVTGSANPVGDPFDIDYVAHEMGHQYGANHTQNNPCNSVSATRMEPGSASTIMGYAGICAPNVQSNSDDHFHGISLEEMHMEIMSGGHTCEAISALSNNPPTITGTNGNVTIPASTPFALTAFVSDPDANDTIIYCWEQMDNQASTQPPLPTNSDGPNFRSNSPTTSDTRYFPNLADLTAGVSPTWEVIPSVSRTMNFRVTVRDQGLNVAGCNDHADVTVTFDDGSGPFVVLYPSVTGIVWTPSTTETVTWDVANTDASPVNCSTVDILLSTDGGLTYPTTLAAGVANDGSQDVTVPNSPTTTARVMVINANGTFFDISDNDFEIETLPCLDPDVPTVGGTLDVCDGSTSTTLSITAGNLNDAADWEWYEASCGGSSIGSGTSVAVSPASTTTYYVRGEGGCVTAGSCTLVEVIVHPNYNTNETASICQGQTYTYPDGSTSTTTETHTSNLTSEFGCDSVIVTDLTVLTTFNSNESASICDGDTYTFPDGTTGTNAQTYTSNLTSQGGCDSVIVTTLTVNSVTTTNESASICDGATYTFPDGTTASTAQVYTSVLTDGNGCDSTIITDLTVNAVDVTVSYISGGLQANASAASYQWIDCDNANAPLSGETAQTFIPAISVGNYAVIVDNGNCSDTSACFMIDQTSIAEEDQYQINIYPNPSTDLITIKWEGEVSMIQLTDARGRLLKVIQTSGLSQTEVELNAFAKGVYFVQLYTTDGRIIKDIVKQ